MVLMRATSRLALRISLGVSRRSVADWKRRWNRFLIIFLERKFQLLVAHLAVFGGFMAALLAVTLLAA